MKISILGRNENTLRNVFTTRQTDEIARLAGEEPVFVETDQAAGGDEEYIFSSWGFPGLDPKNYPKLKAVFYGAGSVQYFAREILSGGVRVFSAWNANAVPVAEFTFSQILLSSKGYVPVMNACRDARAESAQLFRKYPGAYRCRVGLLGLGAIGSRVAEFLKLTDMEVLAFDPFASEEKAKRLNVRLTGLDEIFASCDIVSNHIANLPETKGIIRREHLLSMKPYSTFINTGRGAQLNEEDLADALKADETRTALLDVVTDEAHFDQCVLRRLPNCYFTPHIAGTAGQETERMGQRMVDAFRDVLEGRKNSDEVTLEMLKTMA